MQRENEREMRRVVREGMRKKRDTRERRAEKKEEGNARGMKGARQ